MFKLCLLNIAPDMFKLRLLNVALGNIGKKKKKIPGCIYRRVFKNAASVLPN